MTEAALDRILVIPVESSRRARSYQWRRDSFLGQYISQAEKEVIKHRKNLVSIVASEGMDLAVTYALPHLGPILFGTRILNASQQAFLVDLMKRRYGTPCDQYTVLITPGPSNLLFVLHERFALFLNSIRRVGELLRLPG